jgi:hypothetical protein
MAVSQLFTPNSFDLFCNSITADLITANTIAFTDLDVVNLDVETLNVTQNGYFTNLASPQTSMNYQQQQFSESPPFFNNDYVPMYQLFFTVIGSPTPSLVKVTLTGLQMSYTGIGTMAAIVTRDGVNMAPGNDDDGIFRLSAAALAGNFSFSWYDIGVSSGAHTYGVSVKVTDGAARGYFGSMIVEQTFPNIILPFLGAKVESIETKVKPISMIKEKTIVRPERGIVTRGGRKLNY